MEKIQAILEPIEIQLPDIADEAAHYGGRKGYHTEHMAGLLHEMTEVYRLDPTAEW
jgi:ring-1,2-phenylacetyl-CoA epoxidase subunit PaaC